MIFFIAVLFVAPVFFTCLLVIRLGRKRDLSPFTAFSAGGLLSLSFLDFLPHSFKEASPSTGFWILAGLLIQGVFDLYGSGYLGFLDRWMERFNESNRNPKKNAEASCPDHYHSHILSPKAAVSTMGCLTICSFFDGMRFYSGLTLDWMTALALSVGLFFHLLAEGVTVAGLGVGSRLKQKVLLIWSACLCGSFILGVGLSKGLSDYWSAPSVFAFTVGILIYVCAIHLIPFCLKNRKEGWFALGLVLFTLLHLLHSD